METAAQTLNTPEFASGFTMMTLRWLAEEMKTTRKVLEAIPDAKRDYRPDPKGRTAFELAWHIVTADVDFLDGIADMEFTMEEKHPNLPKNMAELIAWYDENFPKAMARVQAMTAQQLLTPVDFFGVFKMPVFNYLMFANNHSVHHRGQLATYLRPMGSKVPMIYGGSADEPWMG